MRNLFIYKALAAAKLLC